MSQNSQKQLTWPNTTNNFNSTNNLFNNNAPNNMMQNQNSMNQVNVGMNQSNMAMNQGKMGMNQNNMGMNQNNMGNMGFFGNLALGPPPSNNTMPKLNPSTKPNVNQFGNMNGLMSATKQNNGNKKSAFDDLDDLFG